MVRYFQLVAFGQISPTEVINSSDTLHVVTLLLKLFCTQLDKYAVRLTHRPDYGRTKQL